MKINCNFQRADKGGGGGGGAGEGSLTKKMPSMGEEQKFSGTTHYQVKLGRHELQFQTWNQTLPAALL